MSEIVSERARISKGPRFLRFKRKLRSTEHGLAKGGNLNNRMGMGDDRKGARGCEK